MSEATIARWNAIPMAREDGIHGLKRTRPDEDSDDDMSLISRSPSPQPMEVDEASNYGFDSGPATEVITTETRIKPSNKGFAMLAKLGWTEGTPLGVSGDGRIDPIPFQVKRDMTGLGKTNQDVRMIETTVSQRRGLDSERQQKETEEQRLVREDSVARRAAIQTEIVDTLKAFYCSLCEKQFRTVAQYDEHTNSYAHHHKARFRDMQTSQRQVSRQDTDKRKEKEQKRELKELRKIAAAAGIKMTKPTAFATPVLASVGNDSEPSGSKNSGWAALAPGDPAPPRIVPRSQCSTGSPPPPPPPENLPPPPATSVAPAFIAGGYTSLDSPSQQPTPPAPSFQPPPNEPAQEATDSSLTQSPTPVEPSPKPLTGRAGWKQFKAGATKRR